MEVDIHDWLRRATALTQHAMQGEVGNTWHVLIG